MLFLYGALIGLISFLLAMSALPLQNVPSFFDGDTVLVTNLAYLFFPLIGFWTGFCRRSLLWIFVGVSIAPVWASIYILSLADHFDRRFVATIVPSLLGSVAAVALGRGRDSWWDDLPLRVAKGLISGSALPVVYGVVLDLCFSLFYGVMGSSLPGSLDHLRDRIWFAGGVAMAISGGVFLPLFHWAANVPRPRFVWRSIKS